MSGEEARRLKDFSQVSSVDDKGNSDMNSPLVNTGKEVSLGGN